MINMKMKNERTNNGGPEKEMIHQQVVLDLESFLGDLTTGDDDGNDDGIARLVNFFLHFLINNEEGKTTIIYFSFFFLIISF